MAITDKQGLKPTLVVGVKWSNLELLYGSVAGTNITPSLISVSDIITQVKADTTTVINDVTITISDIDKDILYAKFSTNLVYDAVISVYLYLNGANTKLLVRGKISAPITWQHSNRTVSFSVKTDYCSKELGEILCYEPSPNGCLEELPMFPLAYGEILHGPTINYTEYGPPVYTLEQTTYKSGVATYKIPITRAHRYPKDKLMWFYLGAMLCKGKIIQEDNFYYFELIYPNIAEYGVLQLEAKAAHSEDPDASSHNVFWLADADVDLRDKYALFRLEDIESADVLLQARRKNWFYGKIVNQQGKKCWLEEDLSNDGRFIGAPANRFSFNTRAPDFDDLAEAFPAYSTDADGRETIFTNQDDNGVRIDAVSFVPHARWFKDHVPNYKKKLLFPWVIPDGSRLKLAGETARYVFCADWVGEGAVKAVMGYRTVRGRKELVPIPSSYYTKVETGGYVQGVKCSYIEMRRDLKDYECDEWQGDMFVSFVGNRPYSPVNIIQEVVDDNTCLTVDATSKAHVATFMQYHRMGFLLQNKIDAVTFIQEVARQALIGLTIKNDIVYMTYLPEKKTTVGTINEEATLKDSLVISVSETTDIFTRIKGVWREHYAENGERESFYEANIDKFGLHETELNFGFYNTDTGVKHALNYYGKLYTVPWKQIELSVPLFGVNYEVYDEINVSYNEPYVAKTDVTGRVTAKSYKSQQETVTLKIWLPVESGSNIEAQIAWAAYTYLNTVSVLSSVKESDYNVCHQEYPYVALDPYGEPIFAELSDEEYEELQNVIGNSNGGADLNKDSL